MNIKKLKRQFCASIATVLVGFLALGSATYAWYTNNSRVTAEDMTITAQADGIAIEITAEVTDGVPVFADGATTASLDIDTAIEMYPIHPIIDNDKEEARITWGHGYSHMYDDANSGSKLITYNLTADPASHILKSSNSDVFALVADFYVRVNPVSTDSKLTLNNIIAKNVKITDNSPEGETNLLTKCVYLVVEGEEGAYQISDAAAMDAENPFTATETSGTLISSLSTDDEYKLIRVYAYFDGQDKDCKSSQYDTGSISISLEFEGQLGNK